MASRSVYRVDPLANIHDESQMHDKFANRHIPSFMSVAMATEHSALQVLTDGSKLTADALKDGKDLDPSLPIMVRDTPQSIGMKIPRNRDGSNFGIGDVARVVGHKYPVSVIDVEHQEELEGWTLGDLVEYFEDEARLLLMAGTKESSSVRSGRKQRKAAAAAAQRQRKQPKVLNQISMEISKTPLRKLIQSPQFVRDLDWIDHVWPSHRRERRDYPAVQYYCLTSTAGCYTDFHVDFGGTAVWYHVMEGGKEFILVQPTPTNLLVYEEWLCRKDQAAVFLLDMISDQTNVFKVALQPSQTLVIPTGWIHAVYTPEDSLVFGGNFLHGLSIPTQLSINNLETRTRVQGKFRFPAYLELQFYAGRYYLQKLRTGQICQREVDGLGALLHAMEEWWKLGADFAMMRAAKEAAESSGLDSVEKLLQELSSERDRVLANGICRNPDYKEEIKPKLKLKLPPSSNPPTLGKSPKKDGGFRITVPTSALYAGPVTKKKQREGLEEFLPDEVDPEDEWVPGSNGKKAKKPRLSLTSKPAKAKPIKPKSQPKSQPKKKAPTLSARQRLMKRFK